MNKTILKYNLITAANFGADSGNSTIDRPTVLNADTELPIIPAATIKGVIAGMSGNVTDDKEEFNKNRTNKYGHPDRTVKGLNGVPDKYEFGNPGTVIFGDGELLKIPWQIPDKGIAWVISHDVLAKYYFLLNDKFLGFVLGEDEWFGNIPIRPGSRYGKYLNNDIDINILKELVQIGENDYWVIAGTVSMRKFWEDSADIRIQTAINDCTNTAINGSLRAIQYIPSGTVFLSLVTSKDESVINYPVIQMGGMENIGAGFLDIFTISKIQLKNENAKIKNPDIELPDNSEIMRVMHNELKQLIGESYAPKVKTIIKDLGMRWHNQNPGKTLAFCLAKINGKSDEAKAYKWILEKVFSIKNDIVTDVSGYIADWESIPPETLLRIEWLKTFSETMINDKKIGQ